MSFASLLAHRCNVLRMKVEDDAGAPVYTWQPVLTNEPCRLDLQFQRSGDSRWVAEAGRPADRSGTLFVLPDRVKSGDRIEMTAGPRGTFSLLGQLDEVLGRDGLIHHVEVTVEEVAQALRGPRA